MRVNSTNFILSQRLYSYRAVFVKIIAFDKGMPLVNAFVLGNIFEYRPKSYIVEN